MEPYTNALTHPSIPQQSAGDDSKIHGFYTLKSPHNVCMHSIFTDSIKSLKQVIH